MNKQPLHKHPHVLIADPVGPRANQIFHVLEKHYDIRAKRVHSWPQFVRVAHRYYHKKGLRIWLMFLAQELPSEHEDLTKRTDSVLLGYPVQVEHVIWLVQKRRYPFVPEEKSYRLDAPGPSVSEPELLRLLNVCLGPPPPSPPLGPLPPDDPGLEELVRSLDPYQKDLEAGRHYLRRLIGKFWENCESAQVESLPQGFSGAQLLVANVCFRGDPPRKDSYVIKIAPKNDCWKIKNSANWGRIRAAVNRSRYKAHVPKLVRPDHGWSECPKLASSGACCAAAFHFLGKKVGDFVSLGKAYRLWDERPTGLAPDFCQPKERLAEAIVRCVIARLRAAWYDGHARRSAAARFRESPLWAPVAVLPRQTFTPPPYRLSTRRRVLTLDHLKQLDELGKRRLGEPVWSADRDTVRGWLLAGPRGTLAEPRRVQLSPAHGDLNQNNILLWLDEGQVFLIDFDTYQPSGHVLQDFAMLEAEIKFCLMDCESGDVLTAFDLTPEQLDGWLRVEDRLVSEDWRSPVDFGDTRSRICFMERAVELLRFVRGQAEDVHRLAFPGDTKGFFLAYGAALLYHTVRAIAYNQLSPFKRLLAVCSAARLIRMLDKMP